MKTNVKKIKKLVTIKLLIYKISVIVKLQICTNGTSVYITIQNNNSYKYIPYLNMKTKND